MITPFLQEGRTKIYTKLDEYEAFYNPLGEFARSVFVKIFSAYAELKGGGLVYAEPFSGTGVKGLRLLVEGKGFSKAIFNDISEGAFSIILKNIEMNNVKGASEVYKLDVNDFFQLLVARGRVDALDVDPFGSSSPYIFNSLRSVKGGGLISFTFTDSQVLGAIHKDALEKRYRVKAKKVQFLKELQARIAITSVIQEASQLNLAAVPVFAHVDKHYVRTYHLIIPSGSEATKLVKEIRYLYTSDCGYITTEAFMFCPYCGDKMEEIGPIYLGKIFDKRLLEKALSLSDDCKSCKKLFETALEELDEIPFYYETRYLSSVLKHPTPPVSSLLSTLKSLGLKASRTVFSTSGIKTDAPYPIVKSAFYL